MERLDCYYGPPGSGKSYAVVRVAEQIFKETGKITRIYVGDGSGATYMDSGLVDAGVIQLLEYNARPNVFSVVQQISGGAWALEPGNPASPLYQPKPDELAKVGLTVFEGMAMVGNYIMGLQKGGLADRSGRGEKIGQDSPIVIKDGDMTFGGNPVAHYNVAQRHVLNAIERSKGLPGWVIWTSHERGAEDKVSGDKLIGPEVVGGALTASIARHFHNTLHFTTALKKDKQKDAHTGKQVDEADTEYRIYTRDHFDPDGTTFTKYIAVTRCAKPQIMPAYFAAKDSAEPGAHILDFYGKIKEARDAKAAEMSAGIISAALAAVPAA